MIELRATVILSTQINMALLNYVGLLGCINVLWLFKRVNFDQLEKLELDSGVYNESYLEGLQCAVITMREIQE